VHRFDERPESASTQGLTRGGEMITNVESGSSEAFWQPMDDGAYS